MAIRPLFVSKVNTTLQIMLVALTLALAGFGLEAPVAMQVLIWTVGATTLASGAAYVWVTVRRHDPGEPKRMSAASVELRQGPPTMPSPRCHRRSCIGHLHRCHLIGATCIGASVRPAPLATVGRPDGRAPHRDGQRLALAAGLLVAIWLVLRLFDSVLAPFVAAAVMAYALDPPTRYLTRLGVPRGLAALLMILALLFALLLFALLLYPLILAQIGLLVEPRAAIRAVAARPGRARSSPTCRRISAPTW